MSEYRDSKVHELKIHPEYFTQVRNGWKNFELRKDDRDFRCEDILWLREWDPETGDYTGQDEYREILYILRDAEQYGLMPGFSLLSFSPERL